MSKLGSHVSTGNRSRIGEVLDAGMPFVSIVDQNMIAEAHQHGVFVAYRTQRGTMGEDNPSGFMDVPVDKQYQLGVDYLNSQLDIWQSNSGADAYVINNEQDIGTLDHGNKLCQFFLGAMHRADELGLKIVIANFSTGNPSDNNGITLEQRWATMLDAVRYAVDHGHYIGLHIHALDRAPLTDTGEDIAYRHERTLRYFASQGLYPKVLITELSNGVEGIEPNLSSWWDQMTKWDLHVMASTWCKQVIGAALYGWTPAASLTPAVDLWKAWIPAHPDPVSPPPETTVDGIDVSLYQGVIDWTKVKASKRFAFIKATQGALITDPKFAMNWENSKGLPRGAYHYYIFTQSAQSQAVRFWNVFGGSYAGELPPVIDIESKPNATIGSPQMLDWFLGAVTGKFGKRPIIYTGKWWIDQYPQYRNVLSKYDLWIADYVHNPPVVPSPWTTWVFHQSGQGTVDGIVGDVDLNTFNGTLEQFNAYISIAPPVHQESAQGSIYPPVIYDANLDAWTLGTELFDAGYQVLKNGAQWNGGYASLILYYNHTVYVENRQAQWYKVTNQGWVLTTDPRPIPPTPSSAWLGLHQRADGYDHNSPQFALEKQCITVSKVNAVKFMTNSTFESLDQIRALGIESKKIVLRLFADMADRVVTPQEFYGWQTGWLTKFSQSSGVYVEIANEVNIPGESYGMSWHTGAEFATWYSAVVDLIRQNYPTLKMVYPGLSPQPNVPEFEATFPTLIANGKIDLIGAHSYWQDATDMESASGGRYYRRFLKYGKPILLTEVANVGTTDSDATKGAQYKTFAKSLESSVMGIYFFVSSASDPSFNSTRQTFIRNNSLTDIPRSMGA